MAPQMAPQMAPIPQPQMGGPQQPQMGSAPTTMLNSANLARLIIQDSGGPPRTVQLGPQPLSFGRAPDNDIVVASRFVSSHHARIEPDGQGHRIIDTKSTNGLLFNGQRVPHKQLTDGDSVRIGDPLTGNFVTLTYHNLAQQSANQAVQSVNRCDLTAPVISIGREGNVLNLPNPQVSRRHAEVRAIPNGHEVRDLGSSNGTFVNGQRVQARPLQRGDVIQIGPFKLVYDGRSLDQFDQRGAMRIDARTLVRVVGGNRIILNNVSLVIQPREFIALVGGSGAGKSTLMGALSGFNRANKGAVLVNGDNYYENFDAYRAVLGYVPQDDILHSSLPVDEALMYTARLRLPADTAPAEIENRITRVLSDVEMSAHRKKRVSQLSGGQRKRVSISSELLADPSLFFLDEPTSGLDPGLEKKMMYTMRQLADSGRTIVLVTHATANITQCDHVVFMAEGRMVWFGPPNEALQFFGVTSGDFADIYTKLEGPATDDNPLTHGELKREFEFWRQHNPQAKQAPMLAELWEIRFRHSDAYRTYVWERLQNAPATPAGAMPQPQLAAPQSAAPGAYPPQQLSGPINTAASSRPKPPPVSAMRQFKIMTQRYLKLIAADKRNLAILLLQAPIIGLILLLVAKPESIRATLNPTSRMVPFLLGAVAVWFGILNSAREITKEAPIYRRERLANLKIGPYLGSKVAVLAALCFIQSVVLMLVLTMKVDFQQNAFGRTVDQIVTRNPPFGMFGAFLITTFLTSLTGLGIGLLISAAVNSSDKAMSIIPFALIPQMVFALAILPLPAAMAPLSFLTGSRWAMEAFGSIANFAEPRDPATQALFPTVSYDPSAGHIFLIWFILLAYAGVCLAITAWLLKRRDSEA
ncbi:MAG TPA: FHA domain-containing protein [Herpetosiphonaceae bacterium]